MGYLKGDKGDSVDNLVGWSRGRGWGAAFFLGFKETTRGCIPPNWRLTLFPRASCIEEAVANERTKVLGEKGEARADSRRSMIDVSNPRPDAVVGGDTGVAGVFTAMESIPRRASTLTAELRGERGERGERNRLPWFTTVVDLLNIF